VGAVCGLLVSSAVYRYSPGIQKFNPPVVFASLGATAILDYNAIQSPLAQPRASILGHALAATVGVAITKLFMLSSDFESIRWIAGAICCGVSSAVMGMTNTVHPPGGATALMAAVDPAVSSMGWIFVPLVMLGSLLMFLCALLVNNIQRQFPTFWWTPRDVGRARQPDVETATEHARSKSIATQGGLVTDFLERVDSRHAIVITAENVVIPDGFGLGGVERTIVETLRDRLRTREDRRLLGRRLSSDASNMTAVDEKGEGWLTPSTTK